jgi:predicted ester cyclase
MIADMVQRFYTDLWNRWDDASVGDLLSPDFVFRGSLGHDVQGRDGWRRYRDLIRQGSSDFHNEIIDLVVAEDRAAVRLEYSGTHTGPLLGVKPTGRRFSYSGAAFFAASGALLTEAWVLGDLQSLSAQLSGR